MEKKKVSFNFSRITFDCKYLRLPYHVGLTVIEKEKWNKTILACVSRKIFKETSSLVLHAVLSSWWFKTVKIQFGWQKFNIIKCADHNLAKSH